MGSLQGVRVMFGGLEYMLFDIIGNLILTFSFKLQVRNVIRNRAFRRACEWYNKSEVLFSKKNRDGIGIESNSYNRNGGAILSQSNSGNFF